MRPNQTSAAPCLDSAGALRLPLRGPPPVRIKSTIEPPPVHAVAPPLDAAARAEPGPGVRPGSDQDMLLRAISAAARAEDHVVLGSFINGEPLPDTEGMTIKQAAAWLGVDPRTLGRHLTIIPAGPVPPIPQGKVPARLIGNVRRIFKADVLGLNVNTGGGDGRSTQAPTGSDERSRWHRQIDRLREGDAD